MNDMYTVTLSKAQLQLVQTACEDYLRTRIGQFWDLTQDIANADVFDDGFENALSTPSAEIIEAAQKVFDCGFKILDGQYKAKTQKILIAEELFTQIRHELYMEIPEVKRPFWSTASCEPLKLTDEPRIKIKRSKE